MTHPTERDTRIAAQLRHQQRLERDLQRETELEVASYELDRELSYVARAGSIKVKVLG